MAQIAAAPSGRQPLRRPSLTARRSRRVSIFLVLPAVAFTAFFLVIPVIQTFGLSLFKWDGLTNPDFVGFGQFTKVFSDPVFAIALRNNGLFAVLVTVLTVGIGLYFALILNQRVRFWRMYRFIYYLPNILPATIIAIMWANAFDPNYGWLNSWLEAIFGSHASGLLSNPNTAIYVVCFAAIWQVSGFPMIMILGGLQSVPPELGEAARIDGAGFWRTAVSINIPLTKDVIATVTLLQLIFSFKVFDLVQALTRGGPADSTQVFGTLIYRDAFQNGDFGYASAVATVATILIVAVSLLYLRILRPGRIEKAG